VSSWRWGHEPIRFDRHVWPAGGGPAVLDPAAERKRREDRYARARERFANSPHRERRARS